MFWFGFTVDLGVAFELVGWVCRVFRLFGGLRIWLICWGVAISCLFRCVGFEFVAVLAIVGAWWLWCFVLRYVLLIWLGFRGSGMLGAVCVGGCW